MEAVGRAVVGGVGMAVRPARVRAGMVRVVVLVVVMAVVVAGAMVPDEAAVAIGMRALSARVSASSPS
jgi:hypothetical protein